MRALLFAALMPIAPSFADAADQWTLIHAGLLLAIPGETPLTRQTIVVHGRTIEAVRDGYLRPRDVGAPEEGTTVVDLTKRFVLPGLIDLHVHITMQPLPGEHLGFVTDSGADLVLVGARNARQTLAAGFTTIVDLGRPGTSAHEEAAFALRDAIARGTVPGPRILAAGSPISATGLSRQPLYRPEVEAVAGPLAVCDGADDCRRVVREQVRKGADIISFYSTGSLLFPGGVGQAFSDAEMAAITSTAHALGRRVIADGHHAPGTEAAIRAGVDSVDSMHYASDQTLQIVLKTGSYMQSHIYAVTASVGDSLDELESGLDWWHPRAVLERLYAIKMQPFVVVRAYQAGIRHIAFASDAGNFPHGDNARDLVEYVHRGIPPGFALRTATLNAAAVLGLADQLGSIEPGKQADIIATEGDPLVDIDAITKVNFVMRSGVDQGKPCQLRGNCPMQSGNTSTASTVDEKPVD